jgi:hypothetical protein
MTACTVDGCDAPQHARRWCTRHYQRWKRTGHPTGGRDVAPRPSGLTTVERFWSKVATDGPAVVTRPELGPCWVWTAGTRNGFGAFNTPATDTAPQRRVDAHRFAYEQVVGPIPAGHELEHLCHVVDIEHCPAGPDCPHRRCVNPAHLRLINHADRTLRGRSLAARNARQTHCPEGHRYDLVDSTGRRRCRRCLTDNATARYRAAHGLPSRAEDTAQIDAPPAGLTQDPTP